MTTTMTMNVNSKAFEDAAKTAMTDVFNAGKDKDSVYESVCKYANVTKQQFDNMLEEANDKFTQMKNEGLFKTEELAVEELENVCGGYNGLVRLFSDVFGTSPKKVADFIEDTLVPIAVIAGCAAIVAGIVCLSCFPVATLPLVVGGLCAIGAGMIMNDIASD